MGLPLAHTECRRPVRAATTDPHHGDRRSARRRQRKIISAMMLGFSLNVADIGLSLLRPFISALPC